VKAKKINGNGFGVTLGMMAQLSTWNTPTTNDAKQAQAQAQAPTRNLSGQVQHTGPTQSSSPAEMGSTGGYRLNPRFSLWLQGYPAAWAYCGERAMQSCRRSRRRSSERT
jgi:hypothetical protein